MARPGGDNGLMASVANAFLLTLAVRSSAGRARRAARLRRHKSAYVATCFVRPLEFRLLGFVVSEHDVEVLWQPLGSIRRAAF
jgi:hypothetical protein